MLVGAGGASVAPTSYSLISDIFPKRRLASALSVFAIVGTVGAGLSLIVGGLILHWLDGSGAILPLVGHLHGWQVVFVVTGAPGLLLLLIVATLHDPRRPRAREPKGADRSGLGAYLRANRRPPICHLGAFVPVGLVASSLPAWVPDRH